MMIPYENSFIYEATYKRTVIDEQDKNLQIS